MSADAERSALRAEIRRKGACCVRGVFDRRWVDTVQMGLDDCRSDPSKQAKTWVGDAADGRFFQDGFAWNRIARLRQFVFDSPASRLVADLLGASQVNLYMDHLLMREPGAAKETPWHHDTPYCFVDGEDFCTIWFPVDPIPAGEGLRLVSGSHRWGKMFLPVEFASRADYPLDPEQNSRFERVPDIDARIDDYDVLSWELEPGDCVVFYCSMLHSAPPHVARDRPRRVYSTRWLGDDARYGLRPWSVPPLPMDPGLEPGDRFGGALFPRVL